jgi:sulfide:quinone oxidoreductase
LDSRSVVVLGGGLGGVTAATQIRRLLPAQHRVVLVERKQSFSLCMANLWLMTGERAEPQAGERRLEALTRQGIEVVQA